MSKLQSYGKLCTQFYDLDKPSAPPDALAFYLEHARQANGPVLEAMCGSGRFLVPMMQAGIDMDGLDASSDMLSTCQHKCNTLGLQSRLYQQFLHKMNLPRKYKLAFIPAGSFGLITDLEQVREALKRLHNVLLPGGKLVLEVELVANQESNSSGNWGGRWLKRPDGAILIISWLPTYNAQTQVGTSLLRYEVFKDAKLLETELEELALRSYQKGEFDALLEEAGFTDVRTLKLLGNEASNDADLEITVECTRP